MDITGWGSGLFQTLAVGKELFQQKVPVRYISLQADVVIELKIMFVTLGRVLGKNIFITLDGIPLLGYSCKKGYDYDQELW